MRVLPSIIALCVLFALATAAASDANATVQEIFGPLATSPDVQVSYVFPDFPAQRLPSGQIIESLVGFTNNGKRTFNITHIAASLNHPQDFRYYIQNYTKFVYGVLVHPGEQVSLSYKFIPDPYLEPREFGLVVSVYYHDEVGGNFTTAFFNGTVDIVDPDSGFDFQQAFIYLGLFTIVGLGGFFAYKSLSKKTRRTKKSAVPYVEVGTVNKRTPTVTLDSEWLEGTQAVSPPRERPQAKKTKDQKEHKKQK